MSERWVRPYTPGGGRWLVIGWEAVALGLLGWTTVQQFGLTGHGIRVLACVLAAVWVFGAWWIRQMGAYVCSHGLHIRGLIRSRTMQWRDVVHVRLHGPVFKRRARTGRASRSARTGRASRSARTGRASRSARTGRASRSARTGRASRSAHRPGPHEAGRSQSQSQ